MTYLAVFMDKLGTNEEIQNSRSLTTLTYMRIDRSSGVGKVSIILICPSLVTTPVVIPRYTHAILSDMARSQGRCLNLSPVLLTQEGCACIGHS